MNRWMLMWISLGMGFMLGDASLILASVPSPSSALPATAPTDVATASAPSTAPSSQATTQPTHFPPLVFPSMEEYQRIYRNQRRTRIIPLAVVCVTVMGFFLIISLRIAKEERVKRQHRKT